MKNAERMTDKIIPKGFVLCKSKEQSLIILTNLRKIRLDWNVARVWEIRNKYKILVVS